MKPTPEDAQPRRDKWHEHKGTWGEVTVGTVVATARRTERWEIIAVANGMQTPHGHTLWMRAREQVTGAEHSIPPRLKTSTVMILNQDPDDTSLPPLQPATDADALALLVEKLGATHLATRDERTGEITCPDYTQGHNHLDEIGNESIVRGELEHLRFAHGIDTSALEAMDWEERIREIATTHGRAHSPASETGKGGFPHRHVPEDLTIYSGIR